MEYEFANHSINDRFPKFQQVCISNPIDEYSGKVCTIVGWTATRVILVMHASKEHTTRAPSVEIYNSMKYF